MRNDLRSPDRGFGGVAMMAAFGALAIGGFAIGVLAIRRLAIRRLVIDGAKLKSLEIENLTVRELRAADVTISASLTVPERDADPRPAP
jgi:hypothetical protein